MSTDPKAGPSVARARVPLVDKDQAFGIEPTAAGEPPLAI